MIDTPSNKIKLKINKALATSVFFLITLTFMQNCVKADVNELGPSQMLGLLMINSLSKFKLSGTFIQNSGGTAPANSGIDINDQNGGSVQFPIFTPAQSTINYFTLPNSLPNGSNYQINALFFNGANCGTGVNITNGSGTINGADITNIKINC